MGPIASILKTNFAKFENVPLQVDYGMLTRSDSRPFSPAFQRRPRHDMTPLRSPAPFAVTGYQVVLSNTECPTVRHLVQILYQMRMAQQMWLERPKDGDTDHPKSWAAKMTSWFSADADTDGRRRDVVSIERELQVVERCLKTLCETFPVRFINHHFF
jgi:hypothetical protein